MQQPAKCPGGLSPAEQSASTIDDGRTEVAPQAPGSSAGGRSMTDGGLGWHAGRTVTPTPPEPGSEHLATSRRR